MAIKYNAGTISDAKAMIGINNCQLSEFALA
jgi:hypothetical protein